METFARNNEAFHAAIVDLADNPTLSDAHRGLGVAGLTLSLLTEGAEAGQEIADDHRAIVEAYERADVEAAMRVIARHNGTAKVDPAGGRRRRRQALKVGSSAGAPRFQRPALSVNRFDRKCRSLETGPEQSLPDPASSCSARGPRG